MIKPEQIPDEVVRAINEACDSGRAWNTRDTLAAAINAWPGNWYVDGIDFEAKLILPLTQENNT
jgi:hypothetical protein